VSLRPGFFKAIGVCWNDIVKNCGGYLLDVPLSLCGSPVAEILSGASVFFEGESLTFGFGIWQDGNEGEGLTAKFKVGVQYISERNHLTAGRIGRSLRKDGLGLPLTFIKGTLSPPSRR
jgi:hypothetical protein